MGSRSSTCASQEPVFQSFGPYYFGHPWEITCGFEAPKGVIADGWKCELDSLHVEAIDSLSPGPERG
jgi:hypothetical protein